MRAIAVRPPEETAHPAARGTRIRVYVWDLVVRNTHWVIALSMAVLVVTGLYIAHPLGFPAGSGGRDSLMPSMQVVHFYAATFFTLAVLIRLVWFFVSPVRYARWKQFIPVQRYRRRELLDAIKFYSFFRARPPDVIGHNPLAGLSYAGVFILYLVMISSGLALYSADASPGALLKSFQFLVPIYGGLESARFIHHLVMWVLILFAVLHLYANALTSALEANGEVDSIFAGYKFVHPEDVAKELADEAGEHQRERRA